jgi:DNA-binding response OmpR family regulator
LVDEKSTLWPVVERLALPYYGYSLARKTPMALILLIEDNEDLSNALEEVLSFHEFKVMRAANGAQGLDMAQKYLPDLVISDINMPIMNGFEFLDCVKGSVETAMLPVIILSADTRLETIAQALQAGAVDYVSKPFSMPKLLDAIFKHAAVANADAA